MEAPEPGSRPAIFLDRDGTLIHDPGYLSDPEGVELLSGVAEGLAALQAAGFVLVICTNQSGIARGKYTVEAYEAVAARLNDALAATGVQIEKAYYCPFHPEGSVPAFAHEHPLRKPAPGMWYAAVEELDLDPARSWSIGDGERDIVAGKRAGTRGILLAGGRDKWPLPVQGPFDPDFVARDFREATLFILEQEGHPLPDKPGASLAP